MSFVRQLLRGMQARHSWVLSEGEYIVCAFEAEDFEHLVTDALYKAQRYVFEMWLPNHKLSCKPFSIERYAGHSTDTTRMGEPPNPL